MEGLEMSMLTAQCDELREMASRLEWEGFPLPDVTSLLRDAADTIESLRGRLTEQTCINVADPPEEGFWPMPHFKCFVCGAYYVTDKYVYYCPNCGRKVVG
jgi:hypothetical protein